MEARETPLRGNLPEAEDANVQKEQKTDGRECKYHTKINCSDV